MDQLRAILLDLDDTILADDAVSRGAWQSVCRKYGFLAGGIQDDALYAGITRVANEYWRDLENHRRGRLNLKNARREVVRSALLKLGVDNEALGDQIADAYTFEKDRAIYPLPGAIETIRYLKKSGLKLALVTNGASDTQQKKISRFCLGALFDYILIEGEFGEGKPCPAVFRAAMAALGVTAPETCMVGDDLERDIKGAQSLGIRGVWVDWRGVGLKSKSTIKPDDVMRSLTQLPSVLRVPIQGQGA